MRYSVMGKQQAPQVLHKLLNKKISLSFAVIFKVFSFSPPLFHGKKNQPQLTAFCRNRKYFDVFFTQRKTTEEYICLGD